MVPVRQQVNGLQGNVTTSNLAQFLDQPLKVLPVAGYSAEIRAVYTTTAPVLQSNDGNHAWGAVINEIYALKAADQSSKYYYGVVKTSYSGGVAGMGYVGNGTNVGIGWDIMPSASGVMAHEVGHNMGRQHSPCGGASNPDLQYPYSGGGIGIYGLDVSALVVKVPGTFKDFMGYCNPTWVSDYTWSKLITYRMSNPNYAPPLASSSAVAGLLVWGRISQGTAVLEPAVRVAPPSVMPSGSGAYRLEGFATDGRVLFSHPVDPVHTMTMQAVMNHEEHFATVLPLDDVADRELARVRLIGPGVTADRVSLQALAQGRSFVLRNPGATLGRPNGAQATLTWDARTYPVAMVQDVVTGEILSFARGGSATIWTGGSRFHVTFSDGARSVTQLVQ
jgi:hypothetical protein